MQGDWLLTSTLSAQQLVSISYTTYPLDLIVLKVEPGITGGKLGVGFGGNWSGYVGASGKVSMLLPWTDFAGLDRGQVYVGGEVDVMLFTLNLNFGLYGHTYGDNDARDMVILAGIGYTFFIASSTTL